MAIADLLQDSLGARWPVIGAIGDLGAAMGMGVYLVGGPVRDLLLRRPILDIDIVVEGDAIRLARALAARGGGHVLEHAAFGTASWEAPGAVVDLATARRELYEQPAALPRVSPADLRTDLYRRDFSINAMAIDLSPAHRGQLHDPLGGRADLEAGLLRVLHAGSFRDDPTRAWRAARFGARFGFALAPDTAALLQAALAGGALERLGRERLGMEVERALGEEAPGRVLGLAQAWGLIHSLHPALQALETLGARLDGVDAAARALQRRGEVLRPVDALWLVLAEAVPLADRGPLARLAAHEKGAERRWNQGPELVADALVRLEHVTLPHEAARTLRVLDPAERAFALGRTASRPAIAWLGWWSEQGRHIRPALNGHDLLERGIAPGPALGAALRAAEDAAWDGADAARQEAEALRRCGT